MPRNVVSVAIITILVTGAAGFIGSHLCEQLVIDGHEVVGIDGFIDYYPRSIKERNIRELYSSDRFRFVEADLRVVALRPILSDVDVVIHMAAMAGSASWDSFDDYVTCNVSAAQRLLDALVSIDDTSRRRFIQISTSSVYGTRAMGTEDAPLLPVNPYGVTKLAAEKLAFAYHSVFELPVIALRYFSIYGPRQRPDMAYHRFIEALLTGETLTIYGDGEQTRGITFVDDCVRGTIDAMHKGHDGEVYNLGGGVPISVNHAIDILEAAIGTEARRAYQAPRPGDQRDTLANVDKARQHFGYAPMTVPDIGLPLQVEWQRNLKRY